MIKPKKDPVNKENKCGVVYKIDCDCNKSYIGETKRNVKTRLKEHKDDIRLHNDTVVSRHIAENPTHNMDFDNFHILDLESNHSKRRISEMLQIKKYENSTINLKTDLNQLNKKYDKILM